MPHDGASTGLAQCSGYDLRREPRSRWQSTLRCAVMIGLLAPVSVRKGATAVPRFSPKVVGAGLPQCLVTATIAHSLEHSVICSTYWIYSGLKDTIGDAEQVATLGCFTGYAPACVMAGGLAEVFTAGLLSKGVACDLAGIVPGRFPCGQRRLGSPWPECIVRLRLQMAAKCRLSVWRDHQQGDDAQLKLLVYSDSLRHASIAKREFTAVLASNPNLSQVASISAVEHRQCRPPACDGDRDIFWRTEAFGRPWSAARRHGHIVAKPDREITNRPVP